MNAPEGFDLSAGELALCNYADPETRENRMTLKPYEARVYLF